MTRVARALNSSDLQHHEHPCDVDVLQAAGATAIRKQLGVLIVESLEGAAGESPHCVARIKELQKALQRLVRRIAMRRKLHVNAPGVAILVVRELILDRCASCEGRGFIPLRRYDGRRVKDGEELSSTREAECTTCLGSGKSSRDYDARVKAAGLDGGYTRVLADFWEAVLQSCADAELTARISISRRLKRYT